MKIPNRYYYSLITENVDSMCQTKTAGERRGSLRPGGFKGGGVDDPGQTKQGGVCVLDLGGIDAPVTEHYL